MELAPDSAFALNARATGRENLGRYSEAFADYTKAIEIDPKFEAAYYNRGKLYSDQKKPELAVADFTRAIELGLKDADIYTRRGTAQLMLGKTEPAVADYTKAIEIDPDFTDAHIFRGLAYGEQKKTDLAIANFTRAIEIAPNYAPAYFSRGLGYEGQGELDRAIADYTKAIESLPEFTDAYNQLAWLLATVPNSDIRDGNKAVELAEKAVKLKSEYPSYMDTLAAAYAEVGQFAEAVRVQEQAIELVKMQGNEEVVSDAENRLKLYQQNKPFRTEPKVSVNQQPSG